MSEERAPRETETRSESERPKSFVPPTLLPDPIPQDGYVFRYIRTDMQGQSDATNVSMRFREGWEPCRIEDHPELEVVADENSKYPGCVHIGGLLLCKAPREVAESRQRYYEDVASQQMESVDRNYLREGDSRMPLLAPERTSRVSKFGK